MAGLYFEELHVGRVFDHAWTRTVTEMDNVLYSSLTMNVQPLHLDEEFASKTEFGQRIVNSIFTLGLMIGITVNDTTIGTTIANLGMTDVKFPKPVFHGDTLKVRTAVLSIRESKSRPDAGGRSTVRDLRIVVKRSQSKTLKSAVKQARLAKHLRAKVRYSYTAKTATLVMRNVRSDDPHARNTWVIRIMDNLAKYKVRAISAQV